MTKKEKTQLKKIKQDVKELKDIAKITKEILDKDNELYTVILKSANTDKKGWM